jgi:hypothetical protein
MWMGWGRIASLRKWSHLHCQARKRRRRAGVSWQVVFIPLWTWRWGDNMSSPGSSHLWAWGRSPWAKTGSGPRLFLAKPYSNSPWGTIFQNFSFGVAASSWQSAIDLICQEYCPFPITVPVDKNSDICHLNLCPAWSRLLMGILSTSNSWQPCRVMIWLL